jgi:hypothetical protein
MEFLMKQLLLKISAGLCVLATLIAIVGLFGTSSPEGVAKIFTLAGILTTGSIGLFVISLATPKE